MFEAKVTKTIIIEGMHCNHCSKRIEESLKAVKGIKGVSINLEDKKAEVIIKKSIDNEILKNVIEDIGFKVINIEESN